MTLHLHGVVRAAHPLPPAGGWAARKIVVDDLAVVVSSLADGRSLTDQDAIAHLAGLCDLVVTGPVLPLRFGTAAADENAAAAAVHALSVPALRGHLDRLDGLAEMHVHLAFDEDLALSAVFDGDQDRQAFDGGGTDLGAHIRQGELIAQRVVVWRRQRAEALLAPVAAQAREVASVAEQEHTEERRAFLVPLHQVETVRATVAGLGDAEGVTVTCTGPLPAFSFLNATVAPEPDRFSKTTSRWGW
ncbi:hypothetical protein ALI22I_08930 [Saccharothrix sp. ALI-22-I]|uniref:GvpL/GvpF family gas vesicle protein n=1 Tax=Saccharothrix sp. ALI-22-I TaxID=1933778 RepID=UPI00097C1177|nr:GvpL/GvpF family gas vesicle protein [Saccharothrix sp. ALI-22-I]ONI91456.1 hypothetical protein ALI22I_08930 [Saccharothrix sp. ALI-22-I]